MSLQNAYTSLRNLVVLHVVARVLFHGAAADSVLLGWPSGCFPASSLASFLQACLSVVRAATMLDQRNSSPSKRLPSNNAEPCARELLDVGIRHLLANRAANLMDFEIVLRFRHEQTLAFVCSVGNEWANVFDSDCSVHERRALYTITSDVYVMPDSNHFTIGFDHTRDISRRIRGS